MNSLFFKEMERLSEICSDTLKKNNTMREYLKTRKMNNDTIEKFNVGAFPTNLKILLREFEPRFLLETGILYKADQSPFKFYPLIIPIRDVNNNFIGIGGRSMLSELQRRSMGYPKYKNSTYDKAHNLFGLNYAKQSIRETGSAILVEGYFDVITSHQAGIKNVVATSGTYLSSRQILLLSRYCENIKLLFDNDDAGNRTTEKLLERYKGFNLSFSKLKLPYGFKDIDELICKTGLSGVNDFRRENEL